MSLNSYDFQENFLFFLAEGTLFSGAVVGWIVAVFLFDRSWEIVRRWIIGCILVLGCAIVVAISDWSFRGILFDACCMSLGFIVIPHLVAMLFLRSRSWWGKGPTLALWIVFALGGIGLSTAGLLGVGFFMMDKPVQLEIPAGSGYICRQQLFGDAIHSEGVRVTIQKTPWYLPGIERLAYNWNHFNEGNENYGDTLVTEARIVDSIPGKTIVRFKTRDGQILSDTLKYRRYSYPCSTRRRSFTSRTT
jgi:hypothetical protein